MRISLLAALALTLSAAPALADNFQNLKFDFDTPQKLTPAEQTFVQQYKSAINTRNEEAMTDLEGDLTKSCKHDTRLDALPDLADPAVPDAMKIKLVPDDAKIAVAKVTSAYPQKATLQDGSYLPVRPDIIIGVRWANKSDADKKGSTIIDYINIKQNGDKMFLVPWCKPDAVSKPMAMPKPVAKAK